MLRILWNVESVKSKSVITFNPFDPPCFNACTLLRKLALSLIRTLQLNMLSGWTSSGLSVSVVVKDDMPVNKEGRLDLLPKALATSTNDTMINNTSDMVLERDVLNSFKH